MDWQMVPQCHAKTPEEERGYRRGFDQGAASFAYALGIKDSDLEHLNFMRRIADFRYGRAKDAPWKPTRSERQELVRLLNRMAATRLSSGWFPHTEEMG